MSLKEYGKKRKLNATPEPGPAPKKASGRNLIFVIHKHAARNLHYDLRLEMAGVLKSWAVPKGPSLDPSVKRLAMMVEDHPYDYKDFEGVIPEGNYGAGGVIIWDRGVYTHPLAENAKDAEKLLLAGLKKGELKFVLAGKKLKGGFALVKTKWEKNSWLLFKEKDSFTASADVLMDGRSAASGITLEKLTGKNNAPGHENPKKDAIPGNDTPKKSMPHGINPMLSMAVKKPFDRPGWIFEVKWDGYRAIAETGRAGTGLFSRNKNSLSSRFPSVAEALKNIKHDAILDGEVVALDNAGMPDFQKLQDHSGQGSNLIYYAFDILFLDGRDLTSLPLIKRKDILKSIIPSAGSIRYSDHVLSDGISFFNAARKKGLEGIVAKRADSRYQPGSRNGDWLKIKNRLTQDCVIAGFTKPRGSRGYLGSLVLGTYEKGVLTYAGHSGGSFGSSTIKNLYEKLLPLSVKKCPFKAIPPGTAQASWVKPVMVCEVEFTQWTKEGILRHPVFLRVRDDMKAKEVSRDRMKP